VDECASGINDCHANATCTNLLNGYGTLYKCTCKKGFTGSGTDCQGEQAGPAAKANPIQGFAAPKPSALVPPADPMHPMLPLLTSRPDIDECKAAVPPCNPNADCINTVGGFECACKAGYQGTGFVCTGE
jgi:hypothetical protein